jgi:hypothetical protein
MDHFGSDLMDVRTLPLGRPTIKKARQCPLDFDQNRKVASGALHYTQTDNVRETKKKVKKN